ncbi:MAG: TIGR02996 domain-containing protein [Gemmataceae bacterium]|nr:TIGR02996 domain-containing protein [Gemmataceae bacterium]
MPTEREALYAAVLADPDADAPRLVYADWLEEHAPAEADQARARFIRLEIDAETADEPRRTAIHAVAAKLFNRFAEAWNHELPTWNEWYDSSLVYRRGFPFQLHTNFRKLHYGGGRLFAVAPIQSLAVASRDGRPVWYSSLLEPIAGVLPDLGRIREFEIGPMVRLGGSGEGVRLTFQVLTRYPSLANVRVLSLAGCALDDDSVRLFERALRDAVFRECLEELDLSDNLIRANGATMLSTLTGLKSLKVLNLTNNPLTPLGARMLRNHFGDRVVL